MRRRHFPAAFALLMLTAGPVLAQQPVSRVSVGVGGLTVPDMIEITTDIARTVVSVGTYTTDNHRSTGAIGAQYERFVVGRLAVVGAVGIQRIERDLLVRESPAGTLSSTYTHLIGGLSFHYVRGRILGLYSGLAGGFATHTERADATGGAATETEVLPALHVTLLGLRVSRPVGGFIELGGGYRGLIALGLSYEF